MKLKHDFSGYATKTNLKCSDGRTVLKGAFKHQDGKTVPLVWQHLHNDPNNILGHAVLKNREDGVYCYCAFNDTDAGKTSKELVTHGDIVSLSIYANQLKEQNKQVVHGIIREVSLVVSGANPGALIDDVSFSHSDGTVTKDDTEVIIYTGLGLELSHGDDDEADISHEGNDGTANEIFDALTEAQKSAIHTMIARGLNNDSGGEIVHAGYAEDATVEDIFNTLDETQKTVVYAMIAQALVEGEMAQSDEEGDTALKHNNKKGDSTMKTNVFDQSATDTSKNTLTHAQLSEILTDAKRHGSLKDSFLIHAAEYGFDPIDILFPDARNVDSGGPQTYKRPDDWVSDVLSSTTHTPFSRIKTMFADLTVEEARAKGYITGNRKKEEIIPLMKRITTPTTVYKKQKLDRDDQTDITDFDVVVWLKREMRGMLDEELARAILIGDGRDISDEDKINEQNIRPIALDDGSFFVHRSTVKGDTKIDDIIDEFIRARKFYKGSGTPALYTSTSLLTEMLLVKDGMGRRIYSNVTELASVLRVSKIVEVELMNGVTRTVDKDELELLGIVVNLKDYTIGADKGGEVNMFDDFDIDYNQNKYLIETRVSGALTRPKAALIMERTAVG